MRIGDIFMLRCESCGLPTHSPWVSRLATFSKGTVCMLLENDGVSERSKIEHENENGSEAVDLNFKNFQKFFVKVLIGGGIYDIWFKDLEPLKS